MGEDPTAIRQQIEQTRERMGETVDALGYKADVPARTRESIQDKMQGVRARITGVTSQVSDASRGLAAQVSDATPDPSDVKQAVGVVQENPLGLAIGAAAVGFLAGLLVPSTRVEDERLGPVADQVKEQAQQTAQEALERGKQVAQETAQTATQSAQQAAAEIKDTAQRSSQQHAEGLKQSAQESAEQVKDSASS